MTRAEAIEAGLLAEALKKLPELAADVQAEVDGAIPADHTRWRTLCLEFWGRDHEDDNNQAMVGEGLALPPTMAARILSAAQELIENRLAELGVLPEGGAS